jgi:hypothetical protein
MTHVFDTGLHVPQRTVIEEGATDLLSGLLRSNGGYLYNVEPFGGVVRTYTDDEGIASLMDQVKVTPSIALQTGTCTYDTTNLGGGAIGSGGMQSAGELELLVYIATQHQRGRSRGRHRADGVALADDRADPGIHVIMEHVRELLIGQRCNASTAIKQIRPVREEELASRDAILIWLMTFRIKLMVMTPLKGGGAEFRTAGQLLESIGWRTTTEPTEVNRPAAANFSTSVDADTVL